MIAINNSPLPNNEVAPPLIVGNEYKLVQEFVCICGQNHFDVGLKSRYSFISCYKCGKQLPNGDKIHWCHPTRFQ